MVSFADFFVGIFLVILTWYQIQVKGFLHCLSKSKYGVTAHDDISQDLLFFTIFQDERIISFCSEHHFR